MTAFWSKPAGRLLLFFFSCNILNVARCIFQYHCTTLLAWRGNHAFDQDDCLRAYYDLLQFAEVQRTQPREFLGSNTPATSGLPVARVPRKFRRG